ncbi:hypothetical protein MUU74_00365 [Chryseobacterium daecheongense]|uniref:hypothetical protein n=1 Tax=Chryseobacterium daecheongense TaxID=192389 RepID=UPI001FD6D9EE|nr:hypothetical protein [Chryseobacterium daecheongense]UOU98435.1 hypothetical protein MUU74_00365 [Chryseobacterium daecheongense]
MNRKLAILIFFVNLIFTGTIQSQVAFGKDNIVNQSALVEFGTGNKGIILPSVAAAPGSVGGTFIFNTSSKAVEVYEGINNNNNGGWTSLTDENQGVVHSFSNAGPDVTGAKGIIIGANSTTKPGIMVLESTTKAMVLPLVANPHTSIKGAIAGTMVYDTASDTLAVYDGQNWSYWK